MSVEILSSPKGKKRVYRPYRAEKHLAFILLMFGFLYLGHYFIFEDNSSEIYQIPVESQISHYPEPSLHIQYEKEIKITYPNSLTESLSRAPIVILIHGDFMEPEMFNLLTRECLHNGFIIVSQSFNFTYKSFLEINATIDFLKTHPTFQDNPIGLLGHSHGANFAIYSGLYRALDLSFVICADMGDIDSMINDLIYFRTPWNMTIYGTDEIYPEKWKSSILENQIIPNLLIISNSRDSNYNKFVNSLNDDIPNVFNISTINQQYGDFQDKTARYFYLENSLTYHANIILSSKVVIEQIRWMSDSVGWESSHSENSIKFHFSLGLAYMIICTAFAISCSKGFYENLFSLRMVRTQIFNVKLIEGKNNHIAKHRIVTDEAAIIAQIDEKYPNLRDPTQSLDNFVWKEPNLKHIHLFRLWGIYFSSWALLILTVIIYFTIKIRIYYVLSGISLVFLLIYRRNTQKWPFVDHTFPSIRKLKMINLSGIGMIIGLLIAWVFVAGLIFIFIGGWSFFIVYQWISALSVIQILTITYLFIFTFNISMLLGFYPMYANILSNFVIFLALIKDVMS